MDEVLREFQEGLKTLTTVQLSELTRQMKARIECLVEELEVLQEHARMRNASVFPTSAFGAISRSDSFLPN